MIHSILLFKRQLCSLRGQIQTPNINIYTFNEVIKGYKCFFFIYSFFSTIKLTSCSKRKLWSPTPSEARKVARSTRKQSQTVKNRVIPSGQFDYSGVFVHIVCLGKKASSKLHSKALCNNN